MDVFESVWQCNLMGDVGYWHYQWFPDGYELMLFLDTEIADGGWFQVTVERVDWGQGMSCNGYYEVSGWSGQYIRLYFDNLSSNGPVTIICFLVCWDCISTTKSKICQLQDP
jgi:hypothetical protein